MNIVISIIMFVFIALGAQGIVEIFCSNRFKIDYPGTYKFLLFLVGLLAIWLILILFYLVGVPFSFWVVGIGG